MHLSSVSPGVSPSTYKILNLPLDQSFYFKTNTFFASDALLYELQLLGENNPIDEYSTEDRLKSIRKAKSACSRVKSCYFISKDKVIIEDLEESSQVSDKIHKDIEPRRIEIKEKAVILSKPPNKKRLERGTFEDEKVTIRKFRGKVKTYNLKKRFGFVKVDNDDKLELFICEDDIVLSGVNIKNFKDSVYKKKPIFLRFNIKKHIREGKEIQKAVEIEIL
ncbi:hypothetical protein SteCoe_18262 [Stentor coeruleus]|uniref:CSD domain-containing protein n=1 Tax=Stentor coeruleus TaxID=5963 RepID=A0A1R2BWW8_9CILI|nr:hypothetical protein SteCoe_18262 [Stentor coeruleus]